jgi:hypothetical protein
MDIVVLLEPFRLSRQAFGKVLKLAFQYIQLWFWVKELLEDGVFQVMVGIETAMVV